MDNETETTDNEQEETNEEVSWEDAFQDAAAEQNDPVLGALGGQAASTSRDDDEERVDLDFLLDISLNVTAEIGRTKMLINELLQLNQGSIITLDKQVGESIDVLVNGKIMARGEVVMVNEMFAIRLTEIIGPKERIRQLN